MADSVTAKAELLLADNRLVEIEPVRAFLAQGSLHPCSKCDGTGHRFTEAGCEDCPVCEGTGSMRETYIVTLLGERGGVCTCRSFRPCHHLRSALIVDEADRLAAARGDAVAA